MTARIFSRDELERVAAGLLPEGFRDPVMVHLVVMLQLRPLIATSEGRTAIAQRLSDWSHRQLMTGVS